MAIETFIALGAPWLALGLFLAMIGLQELGFRLGQRGAAKDPEGRAGVGAIEASVFALLGLLLAFQFGGAATRLDLRRKLVNDEANAIGTAYLRLDLLPVDRQPEFRDLFRRYTESRIKVWEKVPDIEAAMAESRVANKLQAEIWTKALAASQSQGLSASTMLLIPALNQMIDISATRLAAARNHVPSVIVGLLFIVSLLSAVMAGFSQSAGKRRRWFHMILFAGVTAVTIWTILDMEYPLVGLIRIGAADQALVETLQSMK